MGAELWVFLSKYKSIEYLLIQKLKIKSVTDIIIRRTLQLEGVGFS